MWWVMVDPLATFKASADATAGGGGGIRRFVQETEN
jgi:hypothetical protein